jgi:hypothetical protein
MLTRKRCRCRCPRASAPAAAPQTTNILLTGLAAKCTQDFAPYQPAAGGNPEIKASAKCCTTDITLAEYKTLCGKMDAANTLATTAKSYVEDGTPFFRTDLYSSCGTLVTHAESIELIRSLRAKFTPEAKAFDPLVRTPRVVLCLFEQKTRLASLPSLPRLFVYFELLLFLTHVSRSRSKTRGCV